MNKQSTRQARYDEKNTRRYTIKLNFKTDADIIEKLEKEESKQGYIKELIRKDIEKGSI